ncbi:MAG: selenocysteine-specific translation elongation factor, partial [Helicobacter sp.]|nr:selenocysteine-specific translation elongation factor [Helicobacter sp.]
MQENLIVGVIGHINHGKTSLIAALNGFWGDEREEEKKRGITLDLSFSNLSNGVKNIAFIDVPGHEKLIKNMIAGAFGVDYLMLVISGSEGIMPQTLEHLRIASLLGIKNFLVVITKVDLATRESLLCLRDYIAELFSSMGLKYILLESSIYQTHTIQSLKKQLFSLNKIVREDLGYFRYYIDRVFALKGFGCIVSGTLLDGRIALEDKIWCCTLNKLLGIKNLQTHNKNVHFVKSGQRVAINLSGVSHYQLKRGDLLTKKGYLRGFNNIEVALELYEDVAHNSQVFIFIGALKVRGRVLFLKNHPRFATLKCEIPIFSVFDERFILRDEQKTLGGGRVLNPIA